jgi:uncharacterized protein YqgV (UPF0045/DUF77 family)
MMAKKMPFFAVAAFCVAIFPFNAYAGWLDIIKGIASGVIGIPLQSNLQQTAQPAPMPAPSAASTVKSSASATPNAQPTEAEILAALDSLNAVCGKISSQGLPCGVGIGKAGSVSAAQKIASNRAIQELGKSIQTSMEINANDIMETIAEGEEVITKEAFSEAAKAITDTQVKGSQTYMSYSYKRGNAYEFMIVKVLNPALFEKSMAASAKGESIGKQLLEESIKGAADNIREWYKKRK